MKKRGITSRITHASRLIKKKTGLISFAVTVIFLGLSPRVSTLTNADYFITTESIDSAGANAQSANYALHGSAVGEFGVASTASITSAAYIVKNGYVGQLSDLLTSAVSRKTHGSISPPFDINLPLTGTRGVECRTAVNNGSYTLVFTFANPLTSVASVSATATGGIQPGPSTGSIDSSDPHNYIVNLTGLPNAQYITTTLTNVTDSDANFSSSVQAIMGVLVGDVNANGVVTNADVSLVKAQVAAGASVGPSNFRDDINANGVLSNADVSLTKAQVAAGAQLPTPP